MYVKSRTQPPTLGHPIRALQYRDARQESSGEGGGHHGVWTPARRLALGAGGRKLAMGRRPRAQDTDRHRQQAGLPPWHKACSGPVLQLPEWLPKWEQ